MRTNQFMNLPPINYEPSANYILPNQYSPTPIPYTPTGETSSEKEDRLIPFIGGAVLGGIAGNAFARPNYGYGYMPYGYGYGIPYYYPYGGYYSYGGGYLPNTYNNYYYSGYRTTR